MAAMLAPQYDTGMTARHARFMIGSPDADGLVRVRLAERTPDDRPTIEALIRAINPEARSAT